MKNLLLFFGLFAYVVGGQAQCGPLSQTTLPFSEGFESYSGSVVPMANDSVFNCSPTYSWDFHRAGNYGRLSFTAVANTGSQSAVMDVTSNLNYDTNYTTLTINLTAYNSVANSIMLEFYYRESGDETQPADKVWVRGSDTDAWVEVLDWNAGNVGSTWTLASINIGNALQAHSQSFSATTQVRWGQSDDYSWGSDGFAFDDVSIFQVTCPQPTSLGATSISVGAIDLNWVSGGASNWQVQYGRAGGATSIVNSSSTVLSLNGLSEGVNYEFYVRDSCGVNDVSYWSGPFIAYIPCASVSAPYVNDFDTSLVNQSPECWNSYSNYSNGYAEVRSSTIAFSGGKHLAFYNSGSSTTDTIMAITPMIADLTAGDKEVSMMFRQGSADSKLIIGTTDDASGKGAFTAIDTLELGSLNVYEEVFVEITAANGYNGTDQYIALKHSVGSTYDYLYVDNFAYGTISACPKPTALSVSNITSAGADISFDSRGGSSYEYIYGAPGFAQASGTVQSANTNPITITGLNGNTAYEVLVRNTCGASGTSDWSIAAEFTTECNPFNAPYFTDFESDPLDEVAVCWDFYESYSSSNVEVEDYRTHNSGSQSLQLYNSYTTNDTLFAITPQLAGITNGDKQLRFYSQTSDVSSNLIVGTLPSPTATTQFSPLDTINFVNKDVYLEYIVALDAANGYNGTDTYVAFMHGMGTTADYIHIDDFNYEDIPSCVPTQAADVDIVFSNYDSVYVNWTPGAGAKFNVEIGPTGFVPGNGSDDVTTTNSFVGIGNLTGSTTYDIYIKDSCNTGWSPVAGPITFTTDCAPVIAPFIEGFQGGSQPNCWEVTTGTNSTSTLAFWKFSGAPVGGATSNGRPAGSFAWVDGSNPYQVDTLDDITLKSPYIDISGLNVPQLYFELFSNNTTDPGDNVSFYVNLWDGAQWNNSVFSYSGDKGQWQDFTMLFNNYNVTGPVQFEFVVNKTTASNSSQNDFLLDSIVVQEAAPCPRPDNFELVALSSNSATFDLNALNSVDYTIEWGPKGFVQGSGTGNVQSGISSLPYTLGGLNPNSSYDAYVSVNCGPDGSSVWVGPITFTTDCTGPLAAGTYTIGYGPSDDFPNIDTVASVLNACGISGPVVFDVQPGSYVGALHLYGVAGVSATNTITFNGSGSDTIDYNGVGEQATILLDSVSYVTFSGMYIRNMNGAESWGVLLTNQSNYVTIDSCVIEVDATVTSNDNIPVVITNSYKDDLIEGAEVDFFTLTNSTLIGGHTGLGLEGNGDAYKAEGYIVEGNLIKDYYIYGVYGDDLQNVVFRGNTLESQRSVSTDGFYMTDINDFTFEKNKVNVPDYGLYINDGNDGVVLTSNSIIANNIVISSADNAVHLFAVESLNVYHNTFFGEAGFYMDNHVGVDIRNNIFASKADYAFEAADSLLPGDVVDYNLYYAVGSQSSIRIDGNTYADLAAAQAVYTGKNTNSLEGDPYFVSATDLHVTGVLANNVGDNSVGVSEDIDGDARPLGAATVVDLGADEYEPAGDDVGIVSIINPQTRNCGDSNTVVTVVIQNFGVNLASGFNVNVEVSGDATASLVINYSGSLASRATDTVHLSSFSSILGGQFTIKAFTSLTGDQLSLNDTVTEILDLNHAGEISIFASDSSVCAPQSVMLWADTNFAGLPLIWNDMNGNSLGTGDTLNLAIVDSITDVILSVDTSGTAGFSSFVAGAKDTTIAAASAFGTYTSWAPLISAYQTVVISDVKIYPQNSGTLIVDLKEVSSGTIVGSASVQVNQTSSYQPVTTALNLVVPPGDYELRVNPASTIGQMLRNSAGGNYPYGDPSIFELTGQTFGSSNANYVDYYYYFYNMSITSTAGCPRPSSTFTIGYGDQTSAAFTSTIGVASMTGVDVAFDATGSNSDAGSSYTWDFGDGSTGAGVMPTHTFTTNGTYNVKLVVDGACGKDSVTQQVVIEGITLEENELSRSLQIYPNPTRQNINVHFDAGSAQSAVIYLSDMTGKVLLAKEYSNMNGEFTGEVSLENLPKGTYILNVNTDGLSAQRRIIKI